MNKTLHTIETTDIDKFKKRTNNSIRVLAFFHAKKNKSAELEKILRGLVEPTRGEEGNISYILHRQTGEPDYLLFDEIWIDKDALDKHLKKPYIESLPGKIEHLLQDPLRIEVYREIRL